MADGVSAQGATWPLPKFKFEVAWYRLKRRWISGSIRNGCRKSGNRIPQKQQSAFFYRENARIGKIR